MKHATNKRSHVGFLDSSTTRLDELHPQLPAQPVTAVRSRTFRAPTTDGVAMSFAPLTHRVMVVMEVQLADGSVGHGETWANYPAWAWRERRATIDEGIAPLLVGRTFTTPQESYAHLVQHLEPLGRQWGAVGPIFQAISGADVAMWDLATSQQGDGLGPWIASHNGNRTLQEIPVYASSLGPSGVTATAESCQQQNIPRAKIKLGFGADRDRANVLEARQVFGDDVELYGDANQAWSLEEASYRVQEMQDLGLQWIEEPLKGNSAQEFSTLYRRTGAVLATGENLYGAEAFRPYLSDGAVAILQPDVSKVGGVTPYLQIAQQCIDHGVTLNPHLYNGAVASLTTIDLAASIPATELLEWDIRDNPLRAYVDDLLTRHGTAVPPAPHQRRLDLDTLIDFEEPR